MRSCLKKIYLTGEGGISRQKGQEFYNFQNNMKNKGIYDEEMFNYET